MAGKEHMLELVLELRSKEGSRRELARRKLVKMGGRAVPALVELLSDKHAHVRWEACKALGSIVDASAAPNLVKALMDEDIEVQWLAAEGLIMLGERSLKPLLTALQIDFDSVFLRLGAQRVLHALEREKKLTREARRVLDSLRFLEPASSTATASREALESLRKF